MKSDARLKQPRFCLGQVVLETSYVKVRSVQHRPKIQSEVLLDPCCEDMPCNAFIEACHPLEVPVRRLDPRLLAASTYMQADPSL